MKTVGRWVTVSRNEGSRPVDDCQYKWLPRLSVLPIPVAAAHKQHHFRNCLFLFNDVLPPLESTHDARHWPSRREPLNEISGLQGSGCSAAVCMWLQTFRQNVLCLSAPTKLHGVWTQQTAARTYCATVRLLVVSVRL